VDERRLDAVLTCELQHVERATRVHVEVRERVPHSPVVRRLRRGVDHDRDVTGVPLEDLPQRVPVPDVHPVMGVRRPEVRGELLDVPRRRSLGPEELLPHVVVDPHDLQAEPGKMPDRLGADETTRSSNQGDGHEQTLQRSRE
jgi:hypothetical protein